MCEWRYLEGVELSLVVEETTLVRYHLATDRQKPFIHPLRTPSGTLLTWLEPPDHFWHRGLWFSWKLLNNVNHWEEAEGLGGDVGGSVELSQPARVALEHRRAVVETAYVYRSPGSDAVLHERRTLTIQVPDRAGHLRLDWKHAFEAGDSQVVIDRTPITEETPWGGYAGLSFRAAGSFTSFRALDSEGRADASVEHERARWVDLSGTTDGGADGGAGVAAGLAMFDHPANERHPTHWRCILDPGFGYINPAFVLDEPYTLESGAALELRYRVLIHDGWPDAETLEIEAQNYAAE